MPVVRLNTGPALTQQRRLELLHHYLHDTDTPTATRGAACLLLLFAQPLSRILRLTVDDITHDDHGGMLLRLGEPPIPVPEPFAALVADLAADREHLGGVANATCRWLFPSRCPGQPLAYLTLLRRLRKLGFPLQQARASAVRELVLQVPAPVVADALGFHQTTTARQATNAGSTWSPLPATTVVMSMF